MSEDEGKTPGEIILAGLMVKPCRFEAFDLRDSMFDGRARDAFVVISKEVEDHRPERIDPLLLKAAGHDGVGEYLAGLQGYEPIGDEEFRRYYVRFREPQLKKSLIRKIETQAKSKADFDIDELRPELEELDRLKQSGATDSHPTTIFLSEVEPRTVPWLWQNFIPRGRATLISGDPGSAKTWLALDMAARLSRGLPWADGSPGAEPANTYYMSVEDDAHDTLRPRIDSLGGDPSHIAIYNAEHPLHVDLSTEPGLQRIEREIIKVGNVRLVVVDPILDFSGGVNPNAGEEVRALLTPLVSMAARHDFALVMIGHLNKAQTMSAIYRAGGSTSGWLGKCRASFMVFRDIDNQVLRHFVPIKANLAPQDPPQIEFRIADGRIEARTSSEKVNIDEHLNPQRGPEPRERQAAETWLENLFSSRDEIPATEIHDAAQKRGISEATLRRAKASGEYKSLRRKVLGLDDVWVWVKS
jgi:DNA repair protein RadA/Sms